MEKEMKCVLLLSLKEMALRRMAVLLWSDSGILTCICTFRNYRYIIKKSEKEWLDTYEPKVNEKVLNLSLPPSLTKQLQDSIGPIGLQIKRWIDCQKYNFSDQIEENVLLDAAKLRFTTAGAVDYRKTAEELMSCNDLDVVLLYKLACINCLESFIPLLWEKLPKEKKDYFYKKVPYERPIFPCLSFCWPHILNGKLSTLNYLLRTSGMNLTSFNQWGFEHSAIKGNKSASGYFFHKLPHQERQVSLVRTVNAISSDAHDRIFSHRREDEPPAGTLDSYEEDMLFYLLTLMTPEQRIRAFQFEPVPIFFCFLDWPRRDLFLENAGLFWNVFLPVRSNDCYICLFRHLLRSIMILGLYFGKLFQEFFIQSPLEFKKKFVHLAIDYGGEGAGKILSQLFESEDTESIKVIFRNVDAEDRVKLLCSKDVLVTFYNYILCKWHMLELCLREATQSKEDRQLLKEFYIGCLPNEYKYPIPYEFKRLFEFLDETDVEPEEEKKGKLEGCYEEF